MEQSHSFCVCPQLERSTSTYVVKHVSIVAVKLGVYLLAFSSFLFPLSSPHSSCKTTKSTRLWAGSSISRSTHCCANSRLRLRRPCARPRPFRRPSPIQSSADRCGLVFSLIFFSFSSWSFDSADSKQNHVCIFSFARFLVR